MRKFIQKFAFSIWVYKNPKIYYYCIKLANKSKFFGLYVPIASRHNNFWKLMKVGIPPDGGTNKIPARHSLSPHSSTDRTRDS